MEGVNPYRLLAPLLGDAAVPDPAVEAGYLLRSPLAAAIRRQTGGELRLLPWSGVPTDAVGLRQAIADLKAELRSARQAGRTVHLVTHSLGSVIAYLALLELAGEGPDVAVFVSLSSPLGRPPILLWLAQWHPGLPLAGLAYRLDPPGALGVDRWINVYTAWDPLGGPVAASGVDNVALGMVLVGPLPSLAELVQAHTLPLRDAETTGWIARRLAGADTARTQR